MKLGMVGLGRMGSTLARRLLRGGHEVVVFDTNRDSVDAVGEAGAIPSSSMERLAELLAQPRIVWVMLPAAAVGGVIEKLADVLEPGDVVIDGGNSNYRDDIDRAERLADRGIHFVDVGTSGGVFGLDRGFCLMIGGEESVVDDLDPIFATLAPGAAAAPRTPGRAARGTAEDGYLRCGPAGAGHFVKMVHNGIEYGMMAAVAEGLNILAQADVGTSERAADAETAPLADGKYYRYNFEIADVTEVWRRGSVVASWLLDLTAEQFAADPELDSFAGRVSDSGEGRWTLQAAIDEGVPAPVLASALFSRFASRGQDDFGNRVLSAMRRGFGGHEEASP